MTFEANSWWTFPFLWQLTTAQRSAESPAFGKSVWLGWVPCIYNVSGHFRFYAITSTSQKLNTQKLFVILDKLQKVTDASKRSRSHTYSTVTQKKKKPGMNTMRKNYSTTNLRLTFVITLRARNNERMTFYIFFKIILFLAYIWS